VIKPPTEKQVKPAHLNPGGTPEEKPAEEKRHTKQRRQRNPLDTHRRASHSIHSTAAARLHSSDTSSPAFTTLTRVNATPAAPIRGTAI